MACLHFLNRDKVDTNIFCAEFVLHTIPLDREEKSMFFGSSKSLDGASMTLGCAIFNLKKDGDAVFFPNDVNLSSFRRHEVSFDDLVVIFLEIIYSEKLSLVASFTRGISHDFKSYSTFTLLISFIFTSAFTFGL